MDQDNILEPKILNPEWGRGIRRAANASPYFLLQRMTLLDLSWGHSRMEIDLKKRHLQPFGLVHGGVFASLIDATGFMAVYSMAETDVGLTTVELKLNYLSSAASGRLIGFGRCLKLGRNLGLGEASIENEKGHLLAHGTTTVMVQAAMHIPGKVNSIPKYI